MKVQIFKLILQFYLIIIIIQVNRAYKWDKIELDYSKEEIVELAQRSNKTMQKQFQNSTINLYEMYYKKIDMHYYRLLYGVVNKTNNEVELYWNIIGIVRINKNISIYFDHSIYKIIKIKVISIHEPSYIKIQQSMIKHYPKYWMICKYISKIDLIENYLVIYCTGFNNDISYIARRIDPYNLSNITVIGWLYLSEHDYTYN